jgi:2,4-dienoyl-CoA reductase-like NADH-dependent reductase (Old Yellow Enzyme family)
MRDYYVQRASAGLIITECTQVSDQGHGIIRCPGLHRDAQIAGWRRVTDAVADISDKPARAQIVPKRWFLAASGPSAGANSTSERNLAHFLHIKGHSP